MSNAAAEILAHLRTVEGERRRREAEPQLAAKVVAVKAFQQRRFARTYADLLASTRYGAAARFFLDELYGPTDFTHRDAQFARVVPALVRLFPREIVETVAVLAAVHGLSERLDSLLAAALPTAELDSDTYIAAWQSVGHTEERQRQISLTLDIAARLDRLTRRVLVRNSLRLMRGPARAAGLTDLQRFLELGFESFHAMRGAQEFIALVSEREHALVSSLFAASPDQAGASFAQALRSMP